MKILINEKQITNIINDIDPNKLIDIINKQKNPENLFNKIFGDDKGKFIYDILKNHLSKHKQNNNNIDELLHPLKGDGILTSKYGIRKRPTKGASSYHKGVDIAIQSRTPVYAVADGVVSRSGEGKKYGGFIEIDHGNFKTRYAHLSNWNVTKGMEVNRGDVIGESGGGKNDPNRGVSTGPHLHFELMNKNGQPVNPIGYFKNLA